MDRFLIENRVKTRKRPGFFRKFFPIEITFFENFQNLRREFVNRSFERRFHTEKLYNRTFFDKVDMEEDMTSLSHF